MVTDLTTEWREIGAKPIRPDAPAGAPARDDADFLAIQDEIQKMESLVGGPVDWKVVVRGGKIVLGDRSKDLLAASYVCLGLLHEEGFQGLAAGLACLQEMISLYWDALYPDAKRMQKRVDVLVWLREKLAATVGGRSPSPNDREALQACEELARTLDAVLVEKLAEKSPGMSGLRAILQQQIEKLIQTATKSEGKGQELNASEAQPRTAVTGMIATEDDCRSALREADDLIGRAAAFARRQDSSLPWPYRMVRASTWMTLQMPSSLNDGLSRIPPPAPHLVHRYRELLDKGLWPQLLEQVESQFPNLPFWLDPHRIVALALGQLGPSYGLAKEAVEDETKALVRRLPELPACRFSDETPFAEEETRQWLDHLLKPHMAAGSSDARTDALAGRNGERLTELRRQAATLVEQGQAREAVGLLQKESDSVGSERDRFVLALETAKLCLRGGHPNIALSQLEGLDERITRFALDQWEPSLCLDVWKTMWQLLQQLSKDSKPPAAEWAARCEAVHRKICRVDLLSAWDMEPKRTSARPPP